MPIPLIYGNPQARSKTIATAITKGATTSSLLKDFTLTRVKDYSVATIDGETLEASKGDSGAFMDAATIEIDGALNSLSRSVAIGMYGDSSAWIGQVNAEPSEAASTVITLKSTGDVTNFEVGQTLVIYSATSGGTQRSFDGSTLTGDITAVDRSAGTITIGVAYDSSGTIAANDYLFVNGDRGLGISGLAGWLPATAPTSGDSFFGVDRSADVVRLAGNRYDGSGVSIEEALIEGASRIAREGGKPDYCFMSYSKFASLEKSLGSRVHYNDIWMKDIQVGFRGILIHGPRGPINVVPDQNCPDSYAYMLSMENWKLYTLGKAVSVINNDGLMLLRQASSDGVEVRCKFYGNLACNAPGFSGVITL